MAFEYKVIGSISQTSGVTDYPCRLVVGESNGLPLCFSPALWLDASDASTITTESDKVSQWADKSGNARHAAQATADNRPVVGSAVIDGKNTIQFDGSNDYLTVSSFPTDASAYSLFAVLKVDNDPPAAGAQSGFLTFDGDSGLVSHYPYTDGKIYSDFATTARKTVGNPSPSLASAHLLNFDSAASSWQCRINGTQIYTTTLNTVGMSSATNDIGSSGIYFDGDFAEIIIFPSVLSDQNRLLIEGYLAHKWGLESSLPTGHPYKTVAPVMVHCSGHCQSDFGDIRFFDGSDNALDYWIDWGTLTGTTPNQVVEVWVKTDAGTSGTTVKLKYGDAALDDGSCAGTDIFIKFKDFESGSDGDSIATADEDWTTPDGTVEIDTAQKYSGTRSALITADGTATYAYIAHTAASNAYAIRAMCYKSADAANFLPISHGNGTKYPGVRILADGSINYMSSGDHDTGYNCALATWFCLEYRNINFTAGTYDIYYNDVCIKTGADMHTSTGIANQIWIRNDSAAGKSCWVDDLIVRKYANPEPVWGTWGEEELEFTPDKEASDSGTGAETSVVSITSSDSGTGGESSSFYDPSVFWPAEGSDSGTGADSSTAPEATLPTLTDSGTGSDDYSEKFILFANATIAAYSLGGYLPTGSAGTDWPDEFQLFETDDYLGDPLIQEGLLSLTDSYTHVPVTLSAEVKSATLSPCYLEDYYYRIHVVPNYIDLGQMLSEETHDITIWNAYFVPQTMSSVTEVSTDGIDLSEPVTVPYEMAPLEEITYEASVTMSGPSTIGATIYFNFSALFADSTLYCMIVGSRVMIWLWMPREEFTEELHWNTNVLQTRNGEQRIAYLDAPRQTYNFSFSLPSDRYSDVKTSVDKFAHGVWGLPIWKEHSTVSATVGASAIDFDTSCADYQEGGWAMLWESPDKATALLIDTVRADGIDIDPVLGETYENAWIMPMQRAILLEGMEFTRTPGQEAAAMASFLCNDTVDLSDTSPYTQYRGYDVVTNGHYAIDDLSERIIRPTTQIDNGQGPITVLETQDYTQFARTLGLWTETKEDLWALRQWLHARRGRQKPFWLPSYNQDFTLAATIAALTTDIEITGGRALSVYGTFPCDFMMELTDGSIYYRRIITATTAPGGNTTMSIDSAIGREVTRSQIVLWCFMDLVRFNSDAITLRHRNPYYVDASVPLMRVPE